MKIILSFLLLAILGGPAYAQWHDAYKNPFSSWGAYMYDQNVKRHLRERATTPTQAAPAPRASISATDFRRDRRGKDVVAQLLASVSGPEAAQLDSALRSTMAQLGAAGRKDNVANAMTIVVTLAFVVLEKEDFDPSKADELIPQINDALAASPQWRKLGNAERQLMYDSLLLSAAVIALVHQSGDKEASQQIATNVLQQLLGSV